MVRTSPRQTALVRHIRSRYGFLLLAIACLLGLGFEFIYSPPPGIDQPTPVAPFLDSIFPNASPSGTSQNWTVENAFPHLTFIDPVALVEIPAENSYYVASKVGVIWKISNDSSSSVKDNVLDISAIVDTDYDAGLLNAIIHPEFGKPGSANRGYIYLYYRWHPNGDITGCENPSFLRLSRFNRPDGQEAFDPNSEFVIVQTYDEHCWHNGGAMFFDNDGYFYYTSGDAGGINDPYNTTQQIDKRLMSGLFRIDLEMDPNRSHPIRRQQIDPANSPFLHDSSFSQGYFIPDDNPWLDENGSFLEEFYALGLRSPHRAMIDTVTGKIWIGDVGQGSREEISIVDRPGLNLEWPFREGSIQGNFTQPTPLIGESTPPVYDYTHAEGNSIIGGFVYQGMKYQGALNGRYIFGDHGVRNIWSYNPSNGEVIFLANVPATGVGDKNGISSFATNTAGDIFVLKLFGTALDGGIIYRLKEDVSVPEPPQLLSETGAFTTLNPLTPAPKLLPYQVNSPLWSDRAVKKRWIAIPNDGTHDSPSEQIAFSANGTWQFPAGTVMVKHFDLPTDYENPIVTVPVETRFFVITNEGAYGVTYKWNDEGTDAQLLVNSESKDYQVILPGGIPVTQNWYFPSRSDCMTCHNVNADYVLGVKTWQLNGDYTYPGMQTDNQLNTWRHLGVFSSAFEPEDISTFLQSAGISDTLATLKTRVRSYLDSNCSHCHQPNGVASAFDARFSTPLTNQNMIWTAGISPNTLPDHYMVKPRDLGESEIWLRDKSLSTGAMPPLAKNLVDSTYLATLEDWINSLYEESCAEMPVSEQTWLSATNGQGPVEINRSVGSEQPNDGQTITINNQTFALGLGVHAPSEITYATRGDYAIFQSFVGVDDNTCGSGSVKFEVYTDGILAYQSPLLTQADNALFIQVDIAGADQVRLVVNDGDEVLDCDHADWADPRFLPCACTPNAPCDDGDSCTVGDQYNYDCDCMGLLIDSDSDGISDACDVCPGHDDLLDTDTDGIPDGCDECIGMQASICESGDCQVNEDTITSGTHAALLRITSGSKVVGDSNVIFQSTGVIELAPGFKVENGAVFEAQIIDCDNSFSAKKIPEITANFSPILETSSLSSIQDLWITYEIKVRSQISIQIKDKTGKLVYLALAPTYVEVGRYDLQISNLFHDGIYFIQLHSQNGITQRKLLVVDGIVKSISETSELSGNQKKELVVTGIPERFHTSFQLSIKSPYPGVKRATIRITDTSGRIIFQKSHASFDLPVTIPSHSGWTPGEYFLQIRAGEYHHLTSILKTD